MGGGGGDLQCSGTKARFTVIQFPFASQAKN